MTRLARIGLEPVQMICEGNRQALQIAKDNVSRRRRISHRTKAYYEPPFLARGKSKDH